MKYLVIIIFSILFIRLQVNSQCVPATGTVVVTEPGCDGNSGKIVVTATGGTGPYEYGIGGWTTQNSNVFSGLSAGTYNVRILTADNCESWVYGVVLNYTPMEFSSSIVLNTCNDYVAGSINIIPTRGLAPYTFSSDGGTTYNNVDFFQQLDQGAYSYKVKDAKGCVENASFTISKSHINPSVTTTPVQCTGIMGTALVTFGGPDNYTFSIDNNVSVQSGSGTYSYTQLNPGAYQIQCSDINGCNEVFDFIVGDQNISSSITGLVQETCKENNGEFTISTTNGVGPYEYSIDGGLTFVPTDQFTNLNEGVYQAKVIDSRGCESSETVLITNTGGVSGTINQDTTICSGDNARLVVEAFGTSLTYNWNNGLTNDSAHTINPTVTTAYTVSVQDVYGCVLPLAMTVTVNEYPNLTVSSPSVDICKGDSIALTSAGATSYLWSNGDTVNNTVVKSPFGANAIVAYGYNGKCESSITIPVTIHTIDASITDSQHICSGSSTTLFVNSVTSVLFNWLNNSAGGSSQTVSPLVDTDYLVVLTDAFGCKDTLQTTVIIDAAVNVSVSPTTVEACVGDDFSLAVSGANTYLWSDGQTVPVVNYTASANEIITVMGINGECNQSVSVLVTVLPTPLVTITANASSINTGSGIQFGVGNSTASSYSWDFGDGGSANYSIPYHNFLFSGAYFVTLTGKIGSCTRTDTLLVYVGTVGTAEEERELIRIYPNPTTDYITVESTSALSYKVQLINSNGQVLEEKNAADHKLSVTLIDYPNGVYYIRFISAGNEFVKPIIKN